MFWLDKNWIKVYISNKRTYVLLFEIVLKGEGYMNCPFCENEDVKSIEFRVDGAIYECKKCHDKFVWDNGKPPELLKF